MPRDAEAAERSKAGRRQIYKRCHKLLHCRMRDNSSSDMPHDPGVINFACPQQASVPCRHDVIHLWSQIEERLHNRHASGNILCPMSKQAHIRLVHIIRFESKRTSRRSSENIRTTLAISCWLAQHQPIVEISCRRNTGKPII